MDLTNLKDRVASVMDYDPTSETYAAQVIRMLNDAVEDICGRRIWPFMLSEAVIKVEADVTLDLSVVNGSSQFTVGTGLYEEMWGRRVIVNGVEMQIAYILASNIGYFTRDYPGVTGTYDCVIQQQEILIPQTAADIVDVSVRDPESSSGRIQQLTRRDDVTADLDPWQVGTPVVWIPLPQTRTPPPRIGGALVAAASAPGKGSRTVDVCITYTFAGAESEPGKVQTITLGDSEDLRVTLSALSDQTGLYRRIYWRAPDHGVLAWRRASWDSAGVTVTKQPPGAVTSVDIAMSLSFIESETAYLGDRLRRIGGAARVMRLYPRAGTDMNITVTQLDKVEPLVEDRDTTRIPEQAQDVLVDLAVSKLYLKHGNTAMSRIFGDRAETGLRRLEARALTNVQRRIVRGSGWVQQGTSFVPSVGTITFLP
jgi:hypothetical protein